MSAEPPDFEQIARAAMPVSKSIPSFSDRFWLRVRKAEGDACWEWTAAKAPNGYGKIALPVKNNSRHIFQSAHRMAWILVNGPIPEGLWVLHKCDNRVCCRPDHLFLGTSDDNLKDMWSKGRSRGIAIPGRPALNAKIAPEEIASIRRRLAAGESPRSIARELQIDRRTMTKIARGERYILARGAADVKLAESLPGGQAKWIAAAIKEQDR